MLVVGRLQQTRAAQLHLVCFIVDPAWNLLGSCLLLKAPVPHLHMTLCISLNKHLISQPLVHAVLLIPAGSWCYRCHQTPFCTPLQAHGGSNALELEAKSQLLIVVAEATVLGSTESASVPFYTGLFQRAVSGNGVLRPGAKVSLCPNPKASCPGDLCCSGVELPGTAHLVKAMQRPVTFAADGTA